MQHSSNLHGGECRYIDIYIYYCFSFSFEWNDSEEERYRDWIRHDIKIYICMKSGKPIVKKCASSNFFQAGLIFKRFLQCLTRQGVRS